MKATSKAEIHMIVEPLEALVIYKALSGKKMDSVEDSVRKELLEQLNSAVCFGIAEEILG